MAPPSKCVNDVNGTKQCLYGVYFGFISVGWNGSEEDTSSVFVPVSGQHRDIKRKKESVRTNWRDVREKKKLEGLTVLKLVGTQQ